MTKKNHIKIVKVNLPTTISNYNKKQQFEDISRLYLELIENKNKIQPELVNVEYNQQLQNENKENKEMNEKKHEKTYNIEEDKHENENDDKNENENDKNENENNDNENKYNNDHENKYNNDHDVIDKYANIPSNVNYDDIENDIKETEIDDMKAIGEMEEMDEMDEMEEMDEIKENEIEENIYKKKATDNESNILKNLMKTDKKKVKKDKYSIDNNKNINYTSDHKSLQYKKIPTLAELDIEKPTTLKQLIDINEDELEDKKRELLFKFELLKKSYPNSTIPEYTIHTDYSKMEKEYKSSVRKLSLDSSVDNYKTYLIGGFMVTEFLLGNFLGFDMQGFTQQQIVSINSYEKLLIELGEKSYVPSGSNWPVEVRLIFLIIMNAAFFIIGKVIMKKTGSNLMSMLNNLNLPTNTPSVPVVKKRKMKGPNVNLDDLP